MYCHLLVAGVITLVSTQGLASQHGDGKKEIDLYLPKQMNWKDGPASLPPRAKLAVLEGDPRGAR